MLKKFTKFVAAAVALAVSASVLVMPSSAASNLQVYNLDFSEASWLEIPKDKEGEDGVPLGTGEYSNGILHYTSNEAGGFPVVEKETKYGDGLIRFNAKFNRNPAFIVFTFRNTSSGAITYWDDTSSKYGIMCLGSTMTMQIESWKKGQGKSETPTADQEEINPLEDNAWHTVEIMTLKDDENRLHIKVFVDGVRVTQVIDEGTSGGGPLLDAGYFGVHVYQPNKTPLGVDVELTKAPDGVLAPESELTFVDESTLRYRDENGNMVYPEDENNSSENNNGTTGDNGTTGNNSTGNTGSTGNSGTGNNSTTGTAENSSAASGTESTVSGGEEDTSSAAGTTDSSEAGSDAAVGQEDGGSNVLPIVITIIVIVVLAGAGVGGYFIWKKKTGGAAPESPNDDEKKDEE